MTPKYRHETSGKIYTQLESTADAIRARALTVRNAVDEANRRDVQNRKRYSVQGRKNHANHTEWDIYRINADTTTEFLVGGFYWYEEAVLFAADLAKGKRQVAVRGVRGRLRKQGNLLVPDRTASLIQSNRGDRKVGVQKTEAGAIVGTV